MKRATRGLLVILSLLGLTNLASAAPADSERKGFDLPPQSLAVGDSVGRAIFERDGRRVALPPKAVQERIDQRDAAAHKPASTPAPALPAWPAKWAGDPDAPNSY